VAGGRSVRLRRGGGVADGVAGDSPGPAVARTSSRMRSTAASTPAGAASTTSRSRAVTPRALSRSTPTIHSRYPARSAHAPPDARPAPGPDPGEGHAAAAAAAGDPSVAAGAIGDPNTAPGDAGALTAGDPGHAAAAAAAALRDEAAAAAAFRDARVRVRVLDDGTPSSDAPMPSPPQASRTHGGRRVRPSPPRAPAQPPLPPVPVTLPSPRQDARPRALPLVTPLDRAWTPARRVVCVVP